MERFRLRHCAFEAGKQQFARLTQRVFDRERTQTLVCDGDLDAAYHRVIGSRP
ncbi:hypothetical protein [Hydrogenophilus thermoluteolus]|uniref:hypothetical protein n=1 Tax=Hydrogenophilus thermoluteolus TaxID=297 RepID=UPI003F67AF9E